MTVESTLYDALKNLVSDNQVYPDVAPADATPSYIVYQQVGGIPINFLDSATIPSKHRFRFQIAVWGSTRLAVAALALQVENAIRAVTALQPTVESAQVAVFEEDTGLYGSRQDFSFIS